jgi:hypothetical protein
MRRFPNWSVYRHCQSFISSAIAARVTAASLEQIPSLIRIRHLEEATSSGSSASARESGQTHPIQETARHCLLNYTVLVPSSKPS